MSFLFQLKTKERKKEKCEIGDVLVVIKKVSENKREKNYRFEKEMIETKEKKKEDLKKLKESFYKKILK